MKSFLTLILLLPLVACTHAPSPFPEPSPSVAVTSTPSPKAEVNDWNIEQIAVGSDCAKHYWKSRGVAPLGFIKGLADVFARNVRRTRPEIVQPVGHHSMDVLLLKSYSKEPTLENVFTILAGLGMRESSGKYAEGWDTTGHHGSSSEYEAGLFQFSYNSIGQDHALRSLYDEYKAPTSSCLLSVFSEGAKDPHRSVGGTGDGAAFQTFTKECPAFATEYAAILIRSLRNHFGPLVREEAEFYPACTEMFAKVRQTIEAFEK